MRHPLRLWTASIAAVGLVLAGVGLAAAPATAAVSPAQPVVINEVYGGGGNSGGLYNRDFIELRNVSANPVDVTGWAVQYGSATGTVFSALTVLSGTDRPGCDLPRRRRLRRERRLFPTCRRRMPRVPSPSPARRARSR